MSVQAPSILWLVVPIVIMLIGIAIAIPSCERLERRKSGLVYFRDNRTGYCFATKAGEFSLVPCEGIPKDILHEYDVDREDK